MSSGTGIHEAAVEDFVERVREGRIEGVESIYLFGSVARGEERGRDSDVDLFVVLSDDVDRATTQQTLRDLAYEVMLDHDIAISVHTEEKSIRKTARSPVQQESIGRRDCLCITE